MTIVSNVLIRAAIFCIGYFIFKQTLQFVQPFKSLMAKYEDPFMVKMSLMLVVIILGQVVALIPIPFFIVAVPLIELISISLAVSIFFYNSSSHY